MDTPQAPAAPDPTATAAAQSAANKETAVAQYGLNATNQVTPNGSLTYSQIGTWADGTPRFQATTSLSPDQQSLYDKGNITQNNLADIGTSQSAKIAQLLNTPFSTDSATADKIQGIQNEFLDPQWTRNQDALETSLINKGIRPGSQQYTNAMSDFSNQRQKAYDQSFLDSYQTGQNAALTDRNQPINEITALLSGSQVSQPNFTNTPSPGVAPTDVIGAQQQSLNQQNVQFNAQQQQNMGLLNGLFGLGKAAAGGWAMSDIDTKENIEVIGERPDGLHVIDFDYKPEFEIDDHRHRGFIAQEVAQVYPHAVARVASKGNRMAVDYSKVPDLFAMGKEFRRAA